MGIYSIFPCWRVQSYVYLALVIYINMFQWSCLGWNLVLKWNEYNLRKSFFISFELKLRLWLKMSEFSASCVLFVWLATRFLKCILMGISCSVWCMWIWPLQFWLRINTERGVMISDGKSRFSIHGKPIYHFCGT